MKRLRGTALILTAMFAPGLGAQPRKAQPVGLVLESSGASLVRSGDRLKREVAAGDMLFPGDTLSVAKGRARFLYCPEQIEAVLTAGEVALTAEAPFGATGATLQRAKAEPCLLPEIEREPETASLDGAIRAAAPAPLNAAQLSAALKKLPPESRARFDRITVELAKRPQDPRLRMARAVLLENAGAWPEAVRDYSALAGIWNEQPGIRALIHELQQKSGAATPVTGTAYALLIGISKYQFLDAKYQLNYADADAELFRRYLKSARGGELSDDHIVTLTNEQATLAAVRNHITHLTQKAGKDDTVFLMIAAHGVMVREKAFVVTYKSNPQDYATTSYPMAYIQRLLFGHVAPFRRTLVFVDVCHSGSIGAILEPVAASSTREGPESGEHLGLMASQSKEFAIEHQSFGGGHGAFTYFVIRGLGANEADADRNGVLSAGELIDYVRSSVAKATWGKQHPKDELGMEWDAQIASLKADPIPLAEWQVLPRPALAEILRQRSRRGQAPAAAKANVQSQGTPPDLAERIALEDEGEDVLLRYQEGDEVPQARADFDRGAGAFRRALALSPDSLYLAARAGFCQGRMAIFDKRYGEAASLLERSIRMDPSAAFSFNAIGIAYLEQARYAEAGRAFSDAIRRAPFWAYPRHNLALTLTQTGEYDGAIRVYRQAMALAPQYSYLPYNLGLLYQRINRRKEAEEAYVQAKSAAPWRAEPYIALGLLAASQGRTRIAEAFYREALTRNPAGQTLLAARHDLALLLAADRNRLSEALDLWKQNGPYLPSRLSTAEALSRSGKAEEAVLAYRGLLAEKPDLLSASVKLSGELEKLGRLGDAAAELRRALVQKPDSIALFERLAQVESSAGHSAEARAAYESALALAADPANRKRLRSEMKRAGAGAKKRR